MVKLHRHGLIAQHPVGIRGHAREDGKPPLLYSLTRRGMEVAQTREPPAISRKREWRPIEQGRALRLAHDLHALAWGIELHRLARRRGDRPLAHPPLCHRPLSGPAGRLADATAIRSRSTRSPSPTSRRSCDVALKQFAEIKPDLSLELRIPSPRLSFDLLVELDLTSRPSYNRDKLLAYDAFLCGWSLAHPRYQTQGTRPAVVFVCSDARAVLAPGAGGGRGDDRTDRRDGHRTRAVVSRRPRPRVLRRRSRHPPRRRCPRSLSPPAPPDCANASPETASSNSSAPSSLPQKLIAAPTARKGRQRSISESERNETP